MLNPIGASEFMQMSQNEEENSSERRARKRRYPHPALTTSNDPWIGGLLSSSSSDLSDSECTSTCCASGAVNLETLHPRARQPKAAKYRMRGYRTIKPGQESSRSAVYDGADTSSKINEDAGTSNELNYDPDSSSETSDDEDISSEISAWAVYKSAQNNSSSEIIQLINENIFKEECAKPLCVIVVVPHISVGQSQRRNGILETLTKIRNKFKLKMWGWLWCEAGAQIELEKALDIGWFGYPIMAVIDGKKLKYSIFSGNFTETEISKFVRNLSFGKRNTASISGQLPKIKETTMWDGMDEPSSDDEIDFMN